MVEFEEGERKQYYARVRPLVCTLPTSIRRKLETDAYPPEEEDGAVPPHRLVIRPSSS